MTNNSEAPAPHVWIVVPCYNEAGRLDTQAFESFSTTHPNIRFAFVNDGSSDGTLALLHTMQERTPSHVRVVDQQPNAGKAEAVRVGMMACVEAGIDFVGYFDADLATPLEAIDEFIDVLQHQPEIDLVIGSRVALLGRHIDRRPLRHYLGRAFATAASVVLTLPVYDTQCGAKLMRATPAIRRLFDEPFGSRWIFDVELIARYLTGGGSRTGIYELPLRRWTDVGESHVKAHDFLRAAGEMVSIYRRYNMGRERRALLDALSAPFLRYVGAGSIGTAFHFATLAVAVEAVELKPEHATVIGAVVGAVVNYVLNYHLTFASKAKHLHAAPRFFAVAGLSAALNGTGIWFTTQQLGMHYMLGQIACTSIALLVGYSLNRWWTFRAER